MFKSIFISIIYVFLLMPSFAEAYSLIDWFYDTSAPVISTGFAENKAYKDKLEVFFLVSDKDTAVDNVRIFIDDKDMTSSAHLGPGYYKNRVDIDTKKLKEGRHILTFIASDKSKDKNTAKKEIYFDVDNTLPILGDIKAQGKLYYGKTAVFLFKGSENDLDIEGSFQGKVVKCYPIGNKYYRLILGAELSDPYNKKYPLRLSVKDRAGNLTSKDVMVKVYPSKYAVRRFSLRPKKVRLLSADVVMADWERMEEALSGHRAEKFWKGRFKMPADGYITLPFGTKEYINGVERGRHRGVDIANVKGSYIRAANSGVVALAEYLPANGNVIVIDHGRGVFSSYSHLQTIKVIVGQKVWQGQIIGTMGSTGVSTDPHLHFSVSVNDTRVDPMQWVNALVAE